MHVYLQLVDTYRSYKALFIQKETVYKLLLFDIEKIKNINIGELGRDKTSKR